MRLCSGPLKLGSEVRLHMPEVRFGGENGKAVRLEVDPDLVAVRARRGRSLREGPVRSPEAALLDEMEPVLSFPEVGVEVYRRGEREARSPDQLRRELQESPATRFVGHVLVDEQSREPVLYTENLFVKFRDDVDQERCLRVLRDAGLSVKQELPYASNAFFAAAPEGTGRRVFDIADELLGREDVEYCNPELVRRLGRRVVFAQRTSRPPTPSPRARVPPSPSSTRGSTPATKSSPRGARSSPPATQRRTTPTRAPATPARSTARPARGWPAATGGSEPRGWRPGRSSCPSA
jgi:hypothetical protein